MVDILMQKPMGFIFVAGEIRLSSGIMNVCIREKYMPAVDVI